MAEAFDGESINWNARDFPGFFYDLHEDLGREEIFIIASFADDSNRAEPGALVYFKLNTQQLVNGNLKFLNSGKIKFLTCKFLTSKLRSCVDANREEVPHVERFIRRRFKHQRDCSANRLRP
ncbi:MAG: hypothetical protein WBL92_09460 [Methanothrix sp.]